MTLSKSKKLILSILLDAVGMIPFIDIVWAPLSGYLMTRLYQGNKGKLAGVISFIEEIIPGTDFIPTFTLMWLYTYVFSSSQVQKDNIIDIS